MGHARLSPSNHRWPNCPGSVREEAVYPDVPGAAAVDGTGSHLLLEMCLEIDGSASLDSFNGQIIGIDHPDQPSGWLVGPDRIERVRQCLAYIDRRVVELSERYPGGIVDVHAESKSDPGGAFGRDDWHGTCDVTLTVLDSHRCLFVEVIDYKDGRGWVHVEGNTQLLSYAGGKVRQFVASGPNLVRPFRAEGVRDGVRLTVVQPKTFPPVRSHDYTTRTLLETLDDLAWRASRTDDPDAPLIPGKWCQWCKHKPDCTAQSQKSLETLMDNTSGDVIATEGKMLFEVVGSVLDNVAALPSERLAELADARAGVIAAFDRVEAEIVARIDRGETVEGYTMQPGRSSRVWAKSEEEIEKMLKARRLKRDEMYPPKLASPAQIMSNPNLTDEQKAKIERDYITTKAGALKLTKVRAEREPAPSLFADVVQPPAPVKSLFDAPETVQQSLDNVAQPTADAVSFL